MSKVYLFECWTKIPVSLTNGASFRPLLAEYDSNKVALPAHITGGASFMYQQVLSSTTGNTWQYFATEVTGSAATPANNFQFNSSAKYVLAGVMMVASTTTGQIGQIMGIRFSEVAAGHARAIGAIDSSKIVVPGAIDFSRSYTNKHLGWIPDDPSSARFSVAAVDAGRRALIDFSQGTHLNKTVDNIGEGTQYMRLPNAPTNRNLIPDSGFKTWNSNTLYWVPSSWVLLPGLGQDGGNAIGYLGTGSPSGFPEAGLRKKGILLSPGSYTLSAYMDSTFVTANVLDIGLYLTTYPGTPTALDGGVVHLNNSGQVKKRWSVNFALSLKTRSNTTAYSVNDLALDSNGNLQAVTTAGTSGGSTPTWSTTLGGTTTDGTVTWMLINLAANMVGGTKIPFNVLIFPSNATVTAGKYAIISNPQLEVQAPSGTPTPYQENAGDDTTGTMLVDLSNTNHGAMSVSTLLNPQGSLLPGQGVTFTKAAEGTSTLGWSWAQQTFTRPDQSTFTLSAGSQSFTGLTSSHTYYFYVYMMVSGTTATMNFIISSSPDASSLAQAYQDTHYYLGVLSDSTTASGTGSGGTVGDSCPHEDEPVYIWRDGTEITIPAKDVRDGDLIKGYGFAEQKDVYRRVLHIRHAKTTMWYRVQGHLCSPCEQVFVDGQWYPAFKAPGAERVRGVFGYRVEITVKADDHNEKNYYLANEKNYYLASDTPLLIHNAILPRS